MKCKVQYCNNDATHIKTELHEIESECVVIVKTETEICKDHADLISKCESSKIELDTL